MNRSNYYILLILLLLVSFVSFGQSKQDKNKLKQEEKALQKKIENTKNLIKLTRNSEQLTIAELAILNHQIAYREELVSNINYQMRKLNEEIESMELQKIQLENNIKILKDEYAKMLQYAYKNRNDEFNIFYVFSSESYSEAYQRMNYIDQYADYRIKQVNKIKETKNLLDSNLVLLQGAKKEKEVVAVSQEQEKSNFLKDKEAQQGALLKLKQNESNLQQELIAQEKKKKELRKKINAAIEAEIAAAAAASKTKGFTMTPEAKSLAQSFTTNKGKLPWPVEKGAITTKYGTHAHETLAGIKTENKGVDITTEKGAVVRTVFNGTVSSIFTIPGAGKVVMVSHGNYRTVYSNLQEVYVSKGDVLKTKDKVGKLLPAANDKISECHFEIWKISSAGTVTDNPQLWLNK